MRILQIAPLWESVPPPAYGGTEAVVSLLTETLVRAGHQVTLVASGDSKTSAELEPIFEFSLRNAPHVREPAHYEFAHAAHGLAMADGFDIVHNHAGELVASMAQLIRTPMLTTLHGTVSEDAAAVWQRYVGAYNGISKSHAASLPDLAWGTSIGWVYNAIDVATFPFTADKAEALLFLSRISPEKGPLQAIEVARRTGRQLILAGKVDRVDRDFYEELVRPEIDDDQIVFVGEADSVMKRHLYSQAACLLMPLQWEEPFGLVMPEAMACGTPVIALRRGSAPELILDGVTGFVVDSVDEMVAAVARIPSIDARACRAHVESCFSPEIMTANYLAAYERILGTSATVLPSSPATMPTAP